MALMSLTETTGGAGVGVGSLSARPVQCLGQPPTPTGRCSPSVAPLLLPSSLVSLHLLQESTMLFFSGVSGHAPPPGHPSELKLAETPREHRPAQGP